MVSFLLGNVFPCLSENPMPTLGDVIAMTVEEPIRGEFRSFPAR